MKKHREEKAGNWFARMPIVLLVSFAVLVTAQSVRGELIFSDLFENSVVEDATYYSGGSTSGFWSAILSPAGNTGDITENDGKLNLQASGVVTNPYSYMVGNHVSALDFFDHPITFSMSGINFAREDGADPVTQCLEIILNSAAGGGGDDEISVRLWGEGSIQVDVAKNGVVTNLFASQISYVPESVVIYLDANNYEVTFYHPSKIIEVAKGAHGLTINDWNNSGVCPVIGGVRFGADDKWVKFMVVEIKGFNGAIWRELVPEPGKYSRSYMYMDWSDTALTGKNIADKNENAYTWQNVVGESAQVSIYNQNDVMISNQFLKVAWDATNPAYYGTTLYDINSCKRVFIENVAIVQLDNAVGRDTIRIQNCDEVYIKNVFISGSASPYHIRIDGAKYVVIDGVEIEGRDYGAGKVCGNGIWINNDDPESYSNDLQFLVIQNSYIHDYEAGPAVNQDGIAVTSASDGILFNNYIEDWIIGAPADCAIDISYRRSDARYGSNYVFRVERNIFDGYSAVKCNGWSFQGNKMLFCNNLYFDVWSVFFHSGYSVYRINETYIWDDTNAQGYKIWNDSADCEPYAILNNCLYYAFPGNTLATFFYKTPNHPGDMRSFIQCASNLYYMSAPSSYFYKDADVPSNTVFTFAAWKALGKDTGSLLTNTGTLFLDASNYDFRMANGTVASGKANRDYLNHTNAGMRVHKDFLGYYRSTTAPCAGAFDCGNRSSFMGGIVAVPGVIEAEYFDNGGEGSAYHDTSSGNTNGAFRLDEDVDIYAGDNSYFVLSAVGEWLKYTVEVQTSGSYRIDARVCGIRTSNRSFSVYIDNALVATYTFLNNQFHTATIAAAVYLSAGIKEVKVYFANGAIYLNYINFIAL